MTRPVGTLGEVTGFDDAVGLGQVRTASGDGLLFHCTQIADGTRHITVGTRVAFVVLPGRHGRWEAGTVRPVRPDETVPEVASREAG